MTHEGMKQTRTLMREIQDQWNSVRLKSWFES